MHSSEEVAARLAAWRGSTVQVWDYHVSHSFLRLSLKSKSGRPGILDLHDCSRVVFDACWGQCDFQVTFSGQGNRRRCHVLDSTHFEANCAGTYLLEDRETPLFAGQEHANR